MLPPDGAAGAGVVAAAATRARAAERPSVRAARRAETLSVAKFEVEDEIDTTPREDEPSPGVAMEASALVHEVSEPAEELETEGRFVTLGARAVGR